MQRIKIYDPDTPKGRLGQRECWTTTCKICVNKKQICQNISENNHLETDHLLYDVGDVYIMNLISDGMVSWSEREQSDVLEP